MGTVWRAFDEMLQTEVALKEIEFAGGVADEERADRVERALREARHAAKLRYHAHVVTILDVVLDNGLPWIVMELVRSRSLFQVVREDGPLPPREVARIGVALIDALTSAADLGILHRDVKPSNVLLGRDGRVVLTDFGIATSESDPRLTVTGVLGTPLYMAPERLNNQPATLEADLFSLGGTLYFAVEGEAPFARDSFGAMLAAIVMQPPKPPKNGGPITPVLLGLLEKDPKVRLRPAEATRMLTEVVRGGPARVGSAVDPPTEKLSQIPPSRGAAAPAPPADPLPGRAWRGPEGGPAAVPASGAAPRPAAAMADAAAPVSVGAGAGTAGAAGQLTAKGSRPAPPAELTAAEEDGAVALRWAPSPTPDVLYRVTRKVADQSAPGGWRLRVVGTTPVTELFDAGVPKGVPVSYEVVAMFREAALSGAAAGAGGPAGRPGAAPELPSPSRPVTTPPRVWLPTVAALRADLVQDAIALSWRPIPGHDEVIIERTFDRTSSVQGAMRRFRGGGGQFIDNDVQPGATYRYRVWVAPKEPGGLLDPRSGAEVVVTAVPRPRPVMDLESRPTLGGVLLRWKSVPGVLVRIYATPAATGTGLSGTGPFGPAGHEVHTGSLEGRARLVGESRRGSLVDKEATSDIVYTPVSVAGDRAVIGAAVHLR